MSYQPKSRPDITLLINHLEENPEFLVPCLDAPMRSVVMEDTNSLEMAMPSVQNTITHSTPVSFLHRRSATSQEKLSPLRKTHASQGFKFAPLRNTRTYLSAAEKKLRRNSVGTPQALHRETISLTANIDSPLLRTNSFQRHLPSVTCSERGEKDNSSDYFSDTSKELCQTITSVWRLHSRRPARPSSVSCWNEAPVSLICMCPRTSLRLAVYLMFQQPRISASLAVQLV